MKMCEQAELQEEFRKAREIFLKYFREGKFTAKRTYIKISDVLKKKTDKSVTQISYFNRYPFNGQRYYEMVHKHDSN